jgi:hypothetical protein
MSDDDRWTYEEAGPVSRPYMVTGGRTRPRGTRYLDLVDMVVRSARLTEPALVSSPECAQILELCRIPTSVAEVAAIIGLPIGVVRVLLGDLLYENLIEVMESAPRGGVVTDAHLLSRVLERLRALLPVLPIPSAAAPGLPRAGGPANTVTGAARSRRPAPSAARWRRAVARW